jgi:N-dimethylarginine dimethylaminohydrolase
MSLINQKVLMSGTDYFRVEELNPYSDASVQPNTEVATQEHAAIQHALEEAGVEVLKVAAPQDCQDGVYTANWALTRGKKAVLASLPNMRQAEELYAEQTLRNLGFEVVKAPYRFSGQGDALPIGNYLLCGSQYRTDSRMHGFLAQELGYEVIGLQTVPARDENGQEIINKVTGWPDSFFYDIDLAISILRADLIAWCPDAFLPESQEKIRALPFDKIEVSLEEATRGFACNLVSTGEVVVMSDAAPLLGAAIEAKGLRTVHPPIAELAKGGGYIRCTTLSLDNV